MVGRVIRVVILVILLSVVVVVVWMRTTPVGREAADEVADRWQDLRYGAAERDAAAKLTAMGASFGRLPPDNRISTVDFNRNTLGDEGYRLVGKCFHLEGVQFIKCDVNDERMANLAGLIRLTSLTVHDTPELTDAGIKHIAPLRELVGLQLKGTAVGDEGLRTIGQLPELTNLDLSYTRVTDAGLPALCGLGKLQELLLINTAVTDDGVAKLKGLPSLREIVLTGSKVTEKGKAELMKLHPELKIVD